MGHLRVWWGSEGGMGYLRVWWSIWWCDGVSGGVMGYLRV